MVKLARENITMLARYEHVSEGSAGLEDVLLDLAPLARPELGAAGAAAHGRSAASTPACARWSRTRCRRSALSKMAEAFRADAQALVSAAEGEERHAPSMRSPRSRSRSSTRCCRICSACRSKGREHMYAFGHMVWATMGPMNELFQRGDGEHRAGHRVGERVLQSGESRSRTASACRCSSPPIAAR